jgi:hypothetical protein
MFLFRNDMRRYLFCTSVRIAILASIIDTDYLFGVIHLVWPYRRRMSEFTKISPALSANRARAQIVTFSSSPSEIGDLALVYRE